MRPVRPTLACIALGLALLHGSPSPLRAQVAGAAQGPPRVYFDCRSPECDQSYYRTEIGWVSWVRDQADANVYVIMTSQETGAGGREYVLEFTGRAPYQDYLAESRYRALSTDTQRERLDGVALTLGLGLAQFATQSGFRDIVTLSGIYSDEEGGDAGVPDRVVSVEEVDDPWDLWVFEINGRGNLQSETNRHEWEVRGGFNAQRVTPTWKQSYGGNFSRYSLIDKNDQGVTTVDYDRRDFGLNWRVVYSLAQHYSVGFSGNFGRNTRNNQNLWGQFNPAVEYSFFPYEEATRRSLTVFYEIGPVYRHYFEKTVLNRTAELRAEEAVRIGFEQRQPWGNAGVFVRGSHYLHDIHKHNVSLDGNLRFRITRGLDLNLGGSFARVQDQIYLSGEGLDEQERLLELQSRQTDYQVEARFGLSYQFGSLFNNVVNNRF